MAKVRQSSPKGPLSERIKVKVKFVVGEKTSSPLFQDLVMMLLHCCQNGLELGDRGLIKLIGLGLDNSCLQPLRGSVVEASVKGQLAQLLKVMQG